jgi:hypothetical protein
MEHSDVFYVPKAKTDAFQAIIRATSSCFAILHLHKPEPVLMRILMTSEKQFWLRPVLQRDLLALQAKQQRTLVTLNIGATVFKFGQASGSSRLTILQTKLKLRAKMPISVQSLNVVIGKLATEMRKVEKPKKQKCIEVIAEQRSQVKRRGFSSFANA